MKNIELLPVSAEAKARLKEFASQYKRFAKLEIEVLSASDNEVIVKASQLEPVNGRYLTVKEIIDRVKKMFEGEIPETMKLHVRPVVIERSEIENVTKETIRSEMERLGLRDKHLIQYLGITKSVISELINGDKPLTKWHKAAFYYFFKYYAAVNTKDFAALSESMSVLASGIADKVYARLIMELADTTSGMKEAEEKNLVQIRALVEKLESKITVDETLSGPCQTLRMWYPESDAVENAATEFVIRHISQGDIKPVWVEKIPAIDSAESPNSMRSFAVYDVDKKGY